MLNRK